MCYSYDGVRNLYRLIIDRLNIWTYTYILVYTNAYLIKMALTILIAECYDHK